MNVLSPSLWDDESVESLLAAIEAAETRAQAKVVLADLLTLKEIKELSNRINIAKYLVEGQNYKDIQKITGASAATIAEVSKKIKTGSGGYNLILRKITESESLLY